MPNSYTAVFVHFVWATWDREPLIQMDWEAPLYACITAKYQELKCNLYAVGGTENHLHVLLRLPATVTLAQIAQHLKGATAHLVTHKLAPGSNFRWQGAYFAGCVERERLSQVQAYIRNQKQHHAQGTVRSDWNSQTAVSMKIDLV